MQAARSAPYSILHCPEVHGFLPGDRPCSQVLPCGNQLDKHSYADRKLGHTGPNNKYNYYCGQ